MEKPKKVIILGSGAIRIGQAGEFDYSGSQSIKALKEEGIKTVLVNPNIATIQTSDHLADKVYFLPIDCYFVEKIIEKENPDGILLAFGGQTALNTGTELFEKGILKKHNVKVLGTPVEAIQNTEDRDLFVKKLAEIELRVCKSFAVKSAEEAVKAAKKIGYPVMARVAYALGGLGSGVAQNERQLLDLTKKGFAFASQILIEEYVGGWKEVEYEVVRDRYNNCITVCSMENLDPMGIHTGESIVVAPVQTLSAREHYMLRAISIKLIRHLGIVGECNVQFALDPHSEDYRIIEVNARLSRSSALASKATGYPLAFIATKLALGYALHELENSITKDTSACFEPALDYIVLKIPRWDLQKFKKVSPYIGSEMKSVGEIMSIGRTFEETLQKAIRMLGIGMEGLVCNEIAIENLENELKTPTDKRLYAVAEAVKKGMTLDRIHELSRIDKWFLYKIKSIVKVEGELREHTPATLPKELMQRAKQAGFSDIQIARILDSDELAVRQLRKGMGILPFVKQIDTLAAEFPAKTNYLYLTYNATENDLPFTTKNQVIVLGGGAYRIGSSVEFDWCCVNAVLTLRNLGYKTIMVNFNPETVSTDYDTCDKLYFDELSFERVADINEMENPKGIIISMGGQIPNNLALKLLRCGINVLGTSPVSIDKAEDRHKFSRLLDEHRIDQPEWKELTTLKEAEGFSRSVGYPVLIRPSYVLSGAAMSVATSEHELKTYLIKASEVNKEHPVVISKFLMGAKEIEIDAVAKDGDIIAYAISEHVENAGVHSGDATMVLPPQKTYLETFRRIKRTAKEIALALKITGPFNIQFLAKDNRIKVIECNLRASRSFPFVSKVLKINFIDLATKAMMGKDVKKISKSSFELDYVGVKAPMFSFSRLKGADPTLSVEMASTGEVACLGDDLKEAFLKSVLSVGISIPKKSLLLSTGPIESKADLLPCIKRLRGYRLYATEGTAEFLARNGVRAEQVEWPLDGAKPNAIDLISEKRIDLIINIPKNFEKEELTNDYMIRRAAVDFDVPLLTNTQVAKLFMEAIAERGLDDLKIKSWDEYQ
ncbi:MAG: carbamoyl-phosphate synthase (glutamine-hydrolyzing) large subunit [archaeon]